MPYKSKDDLNRHLRAKRELDPEWADYDRKRKLAWYHENKDKIVKKTRELTPEQKAARAEYQRQYYYDHPELRNKYSSVRNKKLADERVVKAGRPYPGECEISKCRRRGQTHFDHDHATKLFRGFPCPNCNKILGLVQDNPAILEELAFYLRVGGWGPGPDAKKAKQKKLSAHWTRVYTQTFADMKAK